MTAKSKKPTPAVRKFLSAVRDSRPTVPAATTVAAALAAGLVEYRTGDRVLTAGRWVTVGQGYFLTAAGAAAVG